MRLGPNAGEPTAYDGEVTGFFIRKTCRNQGIGLNLLAVACHYLLQKGHLKLALYNARLSAANAFYRRLGGKVVLEVTQHIHNQPIAVDVFGWELSQLLVNVEQRLNSYPRGYDVVLQII